MHRGGQVQVALRTCFEFRQLPLFFVGTRGGVLMLRSREQGG